MALDAFLNFAISDVNAGISNVATSIVLVAGGGAKMPAVPFNATIWDRTTYASAYLDPNVEIVRVTAIATDTLTVTRGQEGTTAVAHNTAGKTYKLLAGVTALTANKIPDKTGDTFTGVVTFSKGIAGAATAVKTGAYTATTSDWLIPCDSTSATFVLTLFAANAVPAGRPLWIANKASLNQVTITAAGADTIQNGATNATTLAAGNGFRAFIMSDGVSVWYRVA